MVKILKDLHIEKEFPGTFLGLVMGEGRALLIDAPLRPEEVRDWLAMVNEMAEPRYLVLLDAHPDRSLGARHVNLPRISSAVTAETIESWPDTFKGSAKPKGIEADNLNRITGVKRAVPDVVFKDEMTVALPGRPVRLVHRPGPTAGSIWAEIPSKSTVFIGDAVTVNEPPYLGMADIEAWMETLDILRDPPYDEYKVLSSRDGLVDRDEINNMARFLRKVPVRLERMEERQDPEGAAVTIASELVEDFSPTIARTPIAEHRLQAGLVELYRRRHPDED
jgi:glyoxylase-like metal-dependent hydrolase (beta-lactamase superfamily II)